MITFIYKYTKLSTDHETPPNLLYILHFRTEVFIMTIGKEKKGLYAFGSGQKHYYTYI